MFGPRNRTDSDGEEDARTFCSAGWKGMLYSFFFRYFFFRAGSGMQASSRCGKEIPMEKITNIPDFSYVCHTRPNGQAYEGAGEFHTLGDLARYMCYVEDRRRCIKKTQKPFSGAN